MGRLVRNPEVRYSSGPEQIAVARYTLAVNKRFKRQGEQDADFIGCVAFGKAGEFAEKYFKKGQMVSVIGRLQVRKWDDHGTTRWSTDVVVEEQYFAESKGCTPKKDGDTEGGFAKQSAEQAAESRGAAASNTTSSQKPSAAASGNGQQMNLSDSDGFYPVDESIEDDDLPF